MTSSIHELILRYRAEGVLVDTNLLLLLFVGNCDPWLIARFKRTNTFNSKDYEILVRFLSHFAKIATTPNVLTEVSNLSAQLSGSWGAAYFQQFATGLLELEEHYLPSRDIAAEPHLADFGLTDLGMIRVAKSRFLVLTDDLRIADYMRRQSVDVVNFHNIRTFF